MGRRIAFRVMRLGNLDVPNFFDVELRALPTNGHRFEVANVDMLANVEFSALQLTNFRAVGRLSELPTSARSFHYGFSSLEIGISWNG